MTEYLHEFASLLGARDFDELLARRGGAVEETQIDGAPVDGDHGASAQPLSDFEGRLGTNVDSLVELASAISVVPGRQHAANRQQGGVNLVLAPNRLEDIVGRHVDISCVMHDDAALLQDVTNTDGLVAPLPAAVVVTSLYGDDVNATAGDVVTRLGLQDFGEAQVCDDGSGPLGDNQLGGLVELGQRPAIEVVDVGVRDQNRFHTPHREGALASQWINQDFFVPKVDQSAGMSQPCHVDRHAPSIARREYRAARAAC